MIPTSRLSLLNTHRSSIHYYLTPIKVSSSWRAELNAECADSRLGSELLTLDACNCGLGVCAHGSWSRRPGANMLMPTSPLTTCLLVTCDLFMDEIWKLPHVGQLVSLQQPD